ASTGPASPRGPDSSCSASRSPAARQSRTTCATSSTRCSWNWSPTTSRSPPTTSRPAPMTTDAPPRERQGSGVGPVGHRTRDGSPGRSGRSAGGLALDAAPLTLAEPAPDAEPLVVGQRVLEAFGLDLAPGADLLGLAGR